MLDEDRCWQALCERDAAFDGRFVFAVRSTGIFCRPSCPAAAPPASGWPFADGEAARAAGFRPADAARQWGQARASSWTRWSSPPVACSTKPPGP